MKFNIGDRVQSISTKRRGTVRGISGCLVAVELDDQTSGVPLPKFGIANGLFLMEEDYEKISTNKILITSDGKTTLARLYDGEKVTRSAETKCSPTDTYDFATGANLAYDRLMRPTSVEPQDKLEAVKLYCVKSCTVMGSIWFARGKTYTLENSEIRFESGWIAHCYKSLSDFMKANPPTRDCLVPLVSRPAKAGEWVLVTNAHNDGTHINAEIHNGDILQVDMVDSSNRPAKTASNTWLWKDEFLVLDGYDGRYEQTEPQYFNGKVVCVEAHCPLTNSFTAGKVYTFENGKVADNDGDARPLDDAMETLAGWNEEHGGIAKFIEYKGEAT